jgi:TonB family protein
MIPKTALRSLLAVTLLSLIGTASAESKKEIGKRLFETAQKISNIRALGASAFRMESNFRSRSKLTGKETAGRYVETWISGVKWRRDVETSSFHGVEIGSMPNKYSLDTGTGRPDPALYAHLTLLFTNIPLEITGVSERDVSGVKVSCAESKSFGSKIFDCVDPATGVFILREMHSRLADHADQSCTYRDYQKFGEHLFPRSMRCTDDSGDDIELTITKLLAATSQEDNLFTKPPGSIETANCQGRLTAPKVTDDPEPKYPEPHQENQAVAVSVIVGSGGKPQDLRVSSSGGNDFDQPALDAIRHWKFKPATCDGVPVPVQINVQVHFRKY